MIQIHQGVDIVDIARFRDVAFRNADFFADIFTEGEREYCSSQKNAELHFAGRFAAKEACLKALGMGLSSAGMGHALQEIEITRHASGRPALSLNGWAASVSRRKGIYQHTISISHTDHTAVASVVMVADKKEEDFMLQRS
ncbi:MAG: holo-ACP synthase [Nitrospirae bacterium]|nr:holo-ACP synthase [Nitrospirota bacterium]